MLSRLVSFNLILLPSSVLKSALSCFLADRSLCDKRSNERGRGEFRRARTLRARVEGGESSPRASFSPLPPLRTLAPLV